MTPRLRTMTSTRPRLAAALIAAALVPWLAPRLAGAQGNISSQGLGFPPGQLSAGALGTGGATGEIDPASPLNPSNLLRWAGTNSLHASYAPEFRRVTLGDDEARTTVSRFPTIAAIVGVSSRALIGVSASTLLDRTFQTTVAIQQVIGADTVPATETFRSEGAINDVRLAGAYQLARVFRLGLGLHVITGQNRLGLARTFPDTSLFGNISRTDRLDYTGQAASAGFEWLVVPHLTLSASGRVGGSLRAKTAGDTTRAKGGVPDRFGASLTYSGITGSNIAVRADWTGWSSLDGIITSGTEARDAWDVSAGGEVSGPRFANRVVGLRVGARRRTLPFTAVGEQVDETSFAGGFAVPLASDRATFDASASHASRSAGDVRETGWTFGFGLTIRP